VSRQSGRPVSRACDGAVRPGIELSCLGTAYATLSLAAAMFEITSASLSAHSTSLVTGAEALVEEQKQEPP
jgi:hypothetical protein